MQFCILQWDMEGYYNILLVCNTTQVSIRIEISKWETHSLSIQIASSQYKEATPHDQPLKVRRAMYFNIFFKKW